MMLALTSVWGPSTARKVPVVRLDRAVEVGLVVGGQCGEGSRPNIGSECLPAAATVAQGHKDTGGWRLSQISETGSGVGTHFSAIPNPDHAALWHCALKPSQTRVGQLRKNVC